MNPPKSTEPHVVIAGAGIAGMAAAMLLAEAGVRVTLCEAAPEAGGKAKSLRLPDGHPTEHSLRVYTDSYQTLLTLFSRIPTEDGMTVLDNLVGVSLVSAAERAVIGRVAAPVPLKRGRSTFARIVDRAIEPVRQLGRILSRTPLVIVGLAQRGLAPVEVIHYLYAHLRLLWMCRERLFAELSNISYGDYLRFSRKSRQAQEFFAALPRIYVAARPSAEAAAIAPIVLKGLFRLKSTCPQALNDVKLPSIMMMDGPTSERMVDPWIRHLRNLGVDMHFGTRVSGLEFGDGRVTALLAADGRRFACDYAILAVPYLTLREMTKSDPVTRHLPQLARQHAIALEASNGIQCFLRDIPPTWPSFIRPGVVIAHVQSEWSLVSVLQGRGFWRNVWLPEGTNYVLSITWSDVDRPGPVFHRPLTACTPEQIVTECLAQCGLDRSHIQGWRIDHELTHLDEADYERLASVLPPHLASAPADGKRMVNFSPLTILMPGARHRSPGICTDVPNLFLAGEAIYSPELTLFVPTMEKAASSGYLAAHQIIGVAASGATPRLRIDFRDPAPFAVLRRLDRWWWHRRRTPAQPPDNQRDLLRSKSTVAPAASPHHRPTPPTPTWSAP
ncbi:FAD-dependent oxidoreductase [Mycobacterium shinjukuense]|uniref:Oxidoreductase n=1 Tax=Mycobacterium shinjukuense TaxID=398694 RepID=A0A7I7MV54_9MYCO|nr:FAD-dependent oxidoreductase [Mycobacterium shinjukuense]MCV6987045.1 FAD-dependent oxidoreductase [Mycobacterium shinjukuense]BBX75767.1 oxidoreductase [Mycobacterium shinjukuense]